MKFKCQNVDKCDEVLDMLKMIEHVKTCCKCVDCALKDDEIKEQSKKIRELTQQLEYSQNENENKTLQLSESLRSYEVMASKLLKE